MAAALKRAIIAACLLSPVQAAVVAAGFLTSVTAVAPLYDKRLSADGGCDPAGCDASLTRVRCMVASAAPLIDARITPRRTATVGFVQGCAPKAYRNESVEPLGKTIL